jgi:hypothetical protein
MTTAPEPPELQAWRDLCRRLEAVGEQLLSPPFPGDPADRVEGFDHLADQVLCWLGWSIGHPDPRRPFFMRQNDLVTQWGGPNADNVYRHARIDPSLRYRIRGRMHGCEDFILALRAGFMHQAKWGTLGEHTASDLGIGRGDEFEILLGGDEPGALPIPDDVVMVSIREYYLDWAAEEPAFFTIECLDTPAPLPRRTGEEVAARFAEAAAGVEVSMAYWNRYMTEERGKRTDNAFAGSFKLDKGLSAARYGFCFFDLDPDEALIVETDKPEARYWSLQLYVPDWFEIVDPVERITSLNHTQCTVSSDGRLRAVVAHADPGVANWLDTGGRRTGLCMLRWFWPTGDGAPEPVGRVVPLGEVAAALPADHPRVSPDERAAVLAARRTHLAHRFRT